MRSPAESQTIRASDVGTLSISSRGVVLPPGSSPPAQSPPQGPFEVRIDGQDDSGHWRLVYPSGFIKHHQAETVADLAGKVAGVLRARYGAKSVSFRSVPQSLNAGEVFAVEG